MHYSENIGKIRRFFRKEGGDFCAEYIVDFDKTVQCKVLAILLINSKLATPELTRDNVKLLLLGKLDWPKNDGSMHRISTSVELSFLENLGAISFYANYCKIHSGSVCDYNAINDSVKPLYDALELLKKILYGNGFIKPHFHIDKIFANKLMEKNSLFVKLDDFQGVVSEEKNYRIDLDEFRHHNLLPEFLWIEVIASLGFNEDNFETNYSKTALNESQIKILNKWLLICRVYSDSYLINIDFKCINFEGKIIYLDFLESIIFDNSQFKGYQLSNSNFEDIFSELDSSIYMNVGFSGESNVSCKKYTPLTLDLNEIKSKSDINLSNLEILRNILRPSYRLNNENTFYSSLLVQFIKSDIFVNNSSINSFGRLDDLFEKSKEKEELRHLLLNESSCYSGIEYLLYLLTKKDTTTTAVYLFSNRPPYSSIDLPLSEYNTYHLEYFPIICDEFLEVSFDGNQYKISEKDIVELIIAMADEYIHDSYSGEFSLNKDCLDILLRKFSTEQFSYFSECLLSEIEINVDVNNKVFPVSTIYLLFWVVEKIQDFILSNKSDLSNKAQSLITRLYVSCFGNNVDNEDNRLNAYKLFDYLPWWRIDDQYISDILFLIQKPSTWNIKLNDNNSCQYQNKNLTRSYFQLLIGLHSEKRAVYGNSQIVSNLLGLVESCGFSESHNEFCGLFDYESQYDYPLWQKFILLVDDMNDDSFDRVLSILESEIPINRVLELYEKVNKEARKAKILEHIKSPSGVIVDSLGIATLENSLDSACRTGQVGIAKVMLDAGLLLLSDEDSYLINRLPSTRISELKDKWCSYEFKINLLMIISDDLSSNEEKLEKIRACEQPFRNERNHHLRSRLARSCNHFHRNMSALILHETDPNIAYNYFHALYQEDNVLYYSGNRFASKLASLGRNKDSDNIDYKNALSEWLSSIGDSDIKSIDCNFIKNWFDCLIKSNDLRGVDVLWNKLSIAQQKNIPIVTCYCLSLKQRGDHNSANLIFENLKKYHNVTSLGDEAEKQWGELREMIVNDQKPLVIAALSKFLMEEPKSINELRQRYHEIRSKKLKEFISIVGDDSSTIEDFLFKNIYSIIGELQLRKNNLNNFESLGNTTSFRITKEDLVNDWLTSLFDHRLSYLGLSCRDQKRGGQASSKESPGEIDFFLCGNNNDRIAIMEAFRLFSNDTTVIDSHLNKVAGYDQQCLSPVFIIAYCDVNNFLKLCESYNHDCIKREYSGFKKSSSNEHVFMSVEDTSTVKIYKEIRYRGGKPITFYHFMVNLRFDS